MANLASTAPVGPGGRALLVAGATPPMLAALQALAGQAVPPLQLIPCASVAAALAQDAQVPVLVPVQMPLAHLQAALHDGATPGAALTQWCDIHTALLRDCRRARRRVVIVDAAMLGAAPMAQSSVLASALVAAFTAALAGALEQRLEVTFGAVAREGVAPQTGQATDADAAGSGDAEGAGAGENTAKPDLSPVYATIAASVLAGDAPALTVLDELEAMCLGPVSPRSPDPQTIAAAAQLTERLSEERDLLRESLSRTLAQTQVEIQAATQAATQTATQAGARQLTDARTRMQAEVAELTEERGLLRESLTLMLAEMERMQAEQADAAQRSQQDSRAAGAEKALLNARLAALRRQLEDAQQQQGAREAVLGAQILRLTAELQGARDHVGRLYASSSWRVTRPMRAVRRRLGRS